LITGAAGFVGEVLTPLVAARYPEAIIWKGSLHLPTPVITGSDRIRPAFFDLQDADAVAGVVASCRPDAVVHLAAFSNVQDSWQKAEATYRINVLGTVNLLQALVRRKERCRFVHVGSGDIYGVVSPDMLPLRDDRPPRPGNPYAASKYAAEIATMQHGLSYPWIEAVLLRPFAHTGPGQNPGFVCPAFAHQIAQIEAGLQPPLIRVGNLEARRDLCDVRDMARAYLLALEKAPPLQPFNVCSGRSHRIGDLLDTFLSWAKVPISIEVDPDRLRPVDTPEIRGDSSPFRQATGWEPAIPLEQTLRDLLAWYRERQGS